ncbi:MAG: HepT-like ribonuclease domain-containing protein [Candidatus Micrarchaeia archaeon]
MNRKTRLLFQNIIKAIKNIEDFTSQHSYDSFCKDEKTKKAVIGEIYMIRQIIKQVPEPFKQKYKEVPWEYIAKIGDELAHFYFEIDYRLVWDIVKNKLPEVKAIIEKIIEIPPKMEKTILFQTKQLLIKMLVSDIIDTLCNGKTEYKIRNFGKFVLVKKKSRKVKNPIVGEYQIPDTYTIKFLPSKATKKYINRKLKIKHG